MFKFAKKKAKERDLILYLVQELGTMRAQHEYLFNRIRDLEARVERLEPKEAQKIGIFTGEGEI